MTAARRILHALVAALALLAAGAGAQQSPSPTLDKIAAQGRIYLGYREAAAPFTYALPGQSAPVGYLWDVCARMVVALEAQLGRSLSVVPVATTDNARTMLIKNRVVDIDCGGAANTVAREKLVSFTNTVYVSEIKALVRASAGLSSLEQLNGQRVVTVTGDSERQIKRAAIEKGLSFQHQLAYTPADAMALLRAGKSDVFVADDATLSLQRAAHADFVLLDMVLATEPQALMLPWGDLVFKETLDAVLVGMMQRGELTRLYEKWFQGPIPPDQVSLDQPMSPALKAAILSPDDRPVN